MALLSALFAALTGIFAKIGVDRVDPDQATFIRTIVIVIVLGCILAARQLPAPISALSAQNWIFLVLSGLATGASWICYFRALRLGDAARVAPVEKVSVVLVALIGVGFLGEHLHARQWAGLALIVVGVLCVAVN